MDEKTRTCCHVRSSNPQTSCAAGLFARVNVLLETVRIDPVPEQADLPQGSDTFVYASWRQGCSPDRSWACRRPGEVEVLKGLSATTW